MKSQLGVVALGLLSAWAFGAGAQTPEVKEKPPLYTYIGEFAFPRAKWAEVAKQTAVEQKVFDQALAAGRLVGYGSDIELIHTADGTTHDSFWSSMSLAGVLGVLDDLEKVPSTTGSLFASATRHEDNLLVSRYYNWKSGGVKGGYTHVSAYTFKDSAPDNALDVISKTFGVPLFEKLLAEGTVIEYEIDEEQIHTGNPGRFWVVYLCKTAADLDKVDAALGGAFGASPFIGVALDHMVQNADHRDYLERTDAVYK
jgi:hypothetical protein